MIYIDGIAFDQKLAGIIRIPEPEGVPFRSNSSVGIGVQVTQERSPVTQLTLVRYTTPSLLKIELDSIRLKIGQTVDISEIVNGAFVRYADQNFRFTVTKAMCSEWKVCPAWYGYRNGVKVSHVPALRMVSQWTLYAKQIVVI